MTNLVEILRKYCPYNGTVYVVRLSEARSGKSTKTLVLVEHEGGIVNISTFVGAALGIEHNARWCHLVGDISLDRARMAVRNLGLILWDSADALSVITLL